MSPASYRTAPPRTRMLPETASVRQGSAHADDGAHPVRVVTGEMAADDELARLRERVGRRRGLARGNRHLAGPRRVVGLRAALVRELDTLVPEDEFVVDGIRVLDDERHRRPGLELERLGVEPRVVEAGPDGLLALLPAARWGARGEGDGEQTRRHPSTHEHDQIAGRWNRRRSSAPTSPSS